MLRITVAKRQSFAALAWVKDKNPPSRQSHVERCRRRIRRPTPYQRCQKEVEELRRLNHLDVGGRSDEAQLARRLVVRKVAAEQRNQNRQHNDDCQFAFRGSTLPERPWERATCRKMPAQLTLAASSGCLEGSGAIRRPGGSGPHAWRLRTCARSRHRRLSFAARR
jgi:hypothetical protein